LLIEHIGITVKEPFEMADWYEKNLGFKILYKFHKDENSSTAFITDDSCKMALEIIVKGETITEDDWWAMLWEGSPFHGAPGE